MTELRHAPGSEDASPRVLLAHDDRLELLGLVRALTEGGVDVVGEAHTAQQVAQLVARTRPDVFLVSVDLLEEVVSPLLTAMRERQPRTRTIALGRPADAGRGRALCDLGAAGFVSAAIDPRHLPAILHEVVAGTVYLAAPSPEAAVPAAGSLTERELSVLRGAARGLSNAAIGRELWLSPHTVKSHLHRIYAKLDVANRTEAARWALEHRLVEGEAAAA